MGDLLKKLSLLVVTVGILVAFSEFTVRLVFQNITTTGDNTSYFARRWKESSVRLNTLGLREREFQLNKPDDTYRIVVIGDSFTFGQGIHERHRFTNLLQEHLREQTSHYKYEVLNFGRPGANTNHHIDLLREVALGTRPDFILLQWYVNDFEGRNKNRPEAIPLLPFRTHHSRLHQSSVLYYLINQQWSALQETIGVSGSYDEYMLQRFGDPRSSESQNSLLTLKDFIERCKNGGTAVGIVLFPRLADLGKDYPFGFLHDRVLGLCSEEGINCLDLRPTFTLYGTDYRLLWVNSFDPHPGPLANRLAAERIMNAFRHIWLSEVRDKAHSSPPG